MDVCNDEIPVAVLQQRSFATQRNLRPVLVNSRKNNAVPANGKPVAKEVSSRYKSSPKACQTTPIPRPSTPKRAESAERRRPSTASSPTSRRSSPSSPTSRTSPASTPSSKSSVQSSPSSGPSPRSKTPIRDSTVERLSSARRSLVGRAPDGLWPSIRSLSSSFQSESSSSLSSALCSKSNRPVRNPSPDRTTKSHSNGVAERKRTPLRGRDVSEQSENSKPVDNTHARAIDQLRWPAMMGGKVSSNTLLTRSMDVTDKINRSASLSIPSRRFSPTRRMSLTGVATLQTSMNEAARPVSCGGSEKILHLKSSVRNAVPVQLERDTAVARPRRSPSPVLSLVRPSSPNKISQTLSSRGLLSPCRTRPSTPSSPSSSTSSRVGVSSSVFNYISDVQKGKRSPNHMEDAHQLRLLYNRELQWRFVNASAVAALSAQKLIAEETLYNVWSVTSDLCDSVISRRIDVQNLTQEMKSKLILKEQIAYLEDWSALEAEHSNSLSGVIDALKGSTLRLPVTGRAKADVCGLKSAICSAVDVMQAMGSTICHLLTRVQSANDLVSELSRIAATESIMLAECRELIASTAAMQVQDCSLRTHLIQQRQQVQVE